MNISVKNLKKQFGNQLVFQGVSFELHQGDRLAVIGKSGEGKSVIFRMLTGLDKPDEGSLSFENQNPFPARKEISDRMGVVFQYSALIDGYSVWENIGIKLIHEKSLPLKIIHKKVEEILPKVGLPLESMNKMPEELSGGMKKRVALARALFHNPKVLIFDEPNSGLDPINSGLIDDLILSLSSEENITVIITHDMSSLRKIANKVLLIDQQKGYFFDTMERFYHSDLIVVKQFLKTH